MNSSRSRSATLWMILFLCMACPAGAQIADTKHNLSVSGRGPIQSSTEQEICIFCHTPHRARGDVGLLWNRADSTVAYTTYTSSSLYAAVGQPTGASKLCLSCHDGTIALGAVVSQSEEIPFAGGIRFLPQGESLLGSDLSDDHPVSFVYDNALAVANGELISPSTLGIDVRLDSLGMVQCTSCHDPHIDTFGNFLVKPNAFSALCITCHVRTDWSVASHATSPATWSGAGPDPWPHTDFFNVAENACENCHRPHDAGDPERLLNHYIEEDNCLVCHNGNVASTDIEMQLLKTYRHPVQDFVGLHDPSEDFSGLAPPHVECVDCHNPHRLTDNTATPPNVPGTLLGVPGVNATGLPVTEATFAYEICFKCHADNNVTSFAGIARLIPQINTRLEFELTNPSFHPVKGPGRNLNVPSLLPGYTVNSTIYCTDCHTSDDDPANGGVGPSGPHGSINRFLLERNYTVNDNTEESSFEYALCYKCHDRSSLLADESFSEHERHIRDEDVPCSACHDAHGISASQGNAINNAHLINFDLNIVSPDSSNLLQFEDLGTFRGRCYLSCHGKQHDPEEY